MCSIGGRGRIRPLDTRPPLCTEAGRQLCFGFVRGPYGGGGGYSTTDTLRGTGGISDHFTSERERSEAVRRYPHNWYKRSSSPPPSPSESHLLPTVFGSSVVPPPSPSILKPYRRPVPPLFYILNPLTLPCPTHAPLYAIIPCSTHAPSMLIYHVLVPPI